MMLLRFQDPAKLKTKRIVFEDVFPAHDSGTLEQLKELSSRRRVIEESINESRVITEAIAREMAGGLTSRNQQYLQKLELYLPLLENLVAHVHLLCNNSNMRKCISGLNIQWAIVGESPLNFGSPKFFRIDDLRFELGMNIFLYGAILRERAFELLSVDLVESATLYRKAAGVYNYVANELLLPLQPSLTIERPLEVTSSMSSVMSLMCLAEAQAVTVKKAEERKASSKLLAKLHYGVTQTLDEAYSLMETLGREKSFVLARVVEFISSCRFLHQLRSQRHLAEGLASGDKVETAAGQYGVAIGVLRYAVENARRAKAPRNESWRSVFNQETVDAAEMLRKLEYENECVHHDKIPSVDGLPVLEGLRIVQAIPYEPQRWERQLCFRGVDN